MKSINDKEPPTKEEKEELIEGLIFIGVMILTVTICLAVFCEKL